MRLDFRVQVDGRKTAGELEAICREIIKANPRTNGIAFFFFLPGTDTGGTYTAGKAEWAPFGEWGKAGDVRIGDHSKHKLIVKVGDALGLD